MKLRTRRRKAAARYVTDNDTPLELQDAEAAAVNPVNEDISVRFSTISSSSAFFLARIMMVPVLKSHASPFPTCYVVW